MAAKECQIEGRDDEMFQQLGFDLFKPTVQNRGVPEGWISTSEVARRLGLKTQQVRDMLRAGKFPNAEQINPRLWLIPESDLEKVELPKMGRPLKKRRNQRGQNPD